jgi:single-strand DNA-binding protein
MTQSNIAYCNFTIAVNRQFKSDTGEQEADFISAIVWRKNAENLVKFQTKGSLIGIVGRIQTRNYDGDNGKVYVTEVIADSIQFLEPKKSDHPQTDEQIDDTYSKDKVYKAPSVAKKTSDETFKTDDIDSSLPF